MGFLSNQAVNNLTKQTQSYEASQSYLDDVEINIGSGSDLDIFHDGTNSYIRNQNTGILILEQEVTDGKIEFHNDDSSSGTTAYLTVDGDATRNIFNKPSRHPTNTLAYFGDTDQGNLRFDGTYFKMQSGTLWLDAQTSHIFADFGNNFYFRDGSNNDILVVGQSLITQKKNSVLLDDLYLYFGSDSDANIRWDATNSRLDIRSDGDIQFVLDEDNNTSNVFKIINGGSTNIFQVDENGDVDSGNIDVSRQVSANIELTSTSGSGSPAQTTYIKMRSEQSGVRGQGIFFEDVGASNEQWYSGLPYAGSFNIWQVGFDRDTTSGDSSNYQSNGILKVIDDGTNRYVRTQGGYHEIRNEDDGANRSVELSMYANQLNDNSSNYNTRMNLGINNGGTYSYGYLQAPATASTGATETLRFYNSVTMFLADSRHQDDVSAYFGSNNDTEFYHDDSDFYIKNITGDLKIYNDNSSGTLQTWFTLDASANAIQNHHDVYITGGNSSGNVARLFLQSDGSSTNQTQFYRQDSSFVIDIEGSDPMVIDYGGEMYKFNSSGHFEVGIGSSAPQITIGTNSDNNAILKVAGDLNGDGSGTRQFVAGLDYSDNVFRINQGSSFDGTNNGLFIDSNGDITFTENRYAFGVTAGNSSGEGRFLAIEGNADSSSEATGRVFFSENNTTQPDHFGLALVYRGGNSTITSMSGNTITYGGSGNDQLDNAEFGIFGHDDSTTPVKLATIPRSAGYMRFNDNKELRFGEGDDMKIYHDGTNGFMFPSTGSLLIGNFREIAVRDETVGGSGITAVSDNYWNGSAWSTNSSNVALTLTTHYGSSAINTTATGQDQINSMVQHHTQYQANFDNITVEFTNAVGSNSVNYALYVYVRFAGADVLVNSFTSQSLSTDVNGATVTRSHTIGNYSWAGAGMTEDAKVKVRLNVTAITDGDITVDAVDVDVEGRLSIA